MDPVTGQNPVDESTGPKAPIRSPTATAPLRVLIAGPSLDAVGGVASHSRVLASLLPSARYFDQWSGSSARVPNPLRRNARHARTLLQWLAVCRRDRPDVVHLQVSSSGIARDLAYLVIARLNKLPVVLHVHSGLFLAAGSRWISNILLHFATNLSSIVIVLSQDQATKLRVAHARKAHRIFLVGNPLPDLPEPGWVEPPSATSEDVSVLCVAEISDTKGQAELAEAVSRLRARGRRVGLVLAGEWGRVSQESRSALLSAPYVHICGVLQGEAKTRAYDEASVFALFSKSEGQPMAVLEAMSRGLPVVASRTGGIPLLLGEDSGNGLVPARDLEALTDALEKFAVSPRERQTVGAANRARSIQEFSASRHISQLQTLYELAALERCVIPHANRR